MKKDDQCGLQSNFLLFQQLAAHTAHLMYSLRRRKYLLFTSVYLLNITNDVLKRLNKTKAHINKAIEENMAKTMINTKVGSFCKI